MDAKQVLEEMKPILGLQRTIITEETKPELMIGYCRPVVSSNWWVDNGNGKVV